MAILGFEIEEIAQLLALMEARGLEEFLWEEGERSIRIRGPRPPKAPRPQAFTIASPVEAPAPTVRRPAKPKAIAAPKAGSSGALAPDEVALESPTVGTFYRAEKPGAPPLVEIGQSVAVGQTVGIIEAMKVFSEFQAEHAGVIVAIPAKDGQLVHVGTPLIILKRE